MLICPITPGTSRLPAARRVRRGRRRGASASPHRSRSRSRSTRPKSPCAAATRRASRSARIIVPTSSPARTPRPGAGEGRWPLADPGREGGQVRRVLLSLVALGFAVAAAAATPEDRLSAVFDAIEANRVDEALRRVDALLRDYPNFRLAYLVRGDLLLARSRPLLTFGNVVKTVPQDRIEGLREDALARLRAMRSRPSDDRLPPYVLQPHPGQKHVLVVDSRRSRLYVFGNDQGRPRLVADFYVTLGKNGVEKTREGDQKTPIGVYHVTGNLPRSKLTDFYGAGAFPINYPNEWDRRRG